MTALPSSDRGAEYDVCSYCSTENEPYYRNGSGEHQKFALYVCGGPKQKGDHASSQGCGANWERTTRVGAEHNAAVGGIGPEKRSIGNLLPTLQVGRTWSMPSARYSANFDLAFGRFTFRCGHVRKLSKPEGMSETAWLERWDLAQRYDCDECDPEGASAEPWEARA
jgi:hypothetical protein